MSNSSGAHNSTPTTDDQPLSPFTLDPAMTTTLPISPPATPPTVYESDTSSGTSTPTSSMPARSESSESPELTKAEAEADIVASTAEDIIFAAFAGFGRATRKNKPVDIPRTWDPDTFGNVLPGPNPRWGLGSDKPDVSRAYTKHNDNQKIILVTQDKAPYSAVGTAWSEDKQSEARIAMSLHADGETKKQEQKRRKKEVFEIKKYQEQVREEHLLRGRITEQRRASVATGFGIDLSWVNVFFDTFSRLQNLGHAKLDSAAKTLRDVALITWELFKDIWALVCTLLFALGRLLPGLFLITVIVMISLVLSFLIWAPPEWSVWAIFFSLLSGLWTEVSSLTTYSPWISSRRNLRTSGHANLSTIPQNNMYQTFNNYTQSQPGLSLSTMMSSVGVTAIAIAIVITVAIIVLRWFIITKLAAVRSMVSACYQNLRGRFVTLAKKLRNLTQYFGNMIATLWNQVKYWFAVTRKATGDKYSRGKSFAGHGIAKSVELFWNIPYILCWYSMNPITTTKNLIRYGIFSIFGGVMVGGGFIYAYCFTMPLEFILKMVYWILSAIQAVIRFLGYYSTQLCRHTGLKLQHWARVVRTWPGRFWSIIRMGFSWIWSGLGWMTALCLWTAFVFAAGVGSRDLYEGFEKVSIMVMPCDPTA